MAEEKTDVSEEVQTSEPEPAPKSVSGKFAEKSTRGTLDRKP
tara:strand:+ start:31 stop:156 length:126 start_codon:yes stop_codon:yes gene_type:complete